MKDKNKKLMLERCTKLYQTINSLISSHLDGMRSCVKINIDIGQFVYANITIDKSDLVRIVTLDNILRSNHDHTNVSRVIGCLNNLDHIVDAIAADNIGFTLSYELNNSYSTLKNIYKKLVNYETQLKSIDRYLDIYRIDFRNEIVDYISQNMIHN